MARSFRTGIDHESDTSDLQPDDLDPRGLQRPPNVGGVVGARTRDFPHTWTTSPNVPGPLGPMNIGYVHNVVSTNGQWARGELPQMGYGYAFALRRPRFMREPRTDLGSYSFAKG